jgi:hypothetical protein
VNNVTELRLMSVTRRGFVVFFRLLVPTGQLELSLLNVPLCFLGRSPGELLPVKPAILALPYDLNRVRVYLMLRYSQDRPFPTRRA